ncbi:MAG: type II toxin-antitoxin system CcdA family antitoxin [Sporichthyaceae bacterium]
MAGKKKITITIDEDLAVALEAGGNVSAQLNDAGLALVERRRRAERLKALLDALDEQDGPLPEDPEEDARIDRLLGGSA